MLFDLVFLRIGLDKSRPMGEHIFSTVESAAPRPRFPGLASNRADEHVMPHTDFDLAGLARYLHLTPPQVAKLADRGQLPGRKVAGQWRFAKDDIHHWLERRIGLSDEEGLVAVEGVLERANQDAEQPEILIAELLPPEAIAIPLGARTRTSVIDSMVELAAQTGWLWDPQAMAEAVRSREEMHTTALENGVALLHPRRPLPKILLQAFLALGRTASGIPFGAGAPLTDLFFLICSTDERGHLRVLARLSRILAAPGVVDALRAAPDAEAARQQIILSEAQLA
jgi:PTS system nitrogen regulatory IIA component